MTPPLEQIPPTPLLRKGGDGGIPQGGRAKGTVLGLTVMVTEMPQRVKGGLCFALDLTRPLVYLLR